MLEEKPQFTCQSPPQPQSLRDRPAYPPRIARFRSFGHHSPANMLAHNLQPHPSRRLRSQATSSPPQHVQLDDVITRRTTNTISSVPTGTSSDDDAMAPARKKRKTTYQPVERFVCTTCDTERTVRMFPDFNPAVECEHMIHTCTECLKKWVEVQVEGAEFVRRTDAFSAKEGGDSGEVVDSGEGGDAKDGGTKEGGSSEVAAKVDTEPAKGLLFGLKCPHPDCEGVMRNVNVRNAATRKVYGQFQTAERKFIGDNTPGWRWCLGVGCKAGQVHAPLLTPRHEAAASKRPKKAARKKKADIVIYEDPETATPLIDEDSICTCYECGTRACVNCDRPYHDGESCAQYQLRTKDRLEEEDKALQKIRNSTKACPNCKKRIEKRGGCPSMWCTFCKTSFCWTCETVQNQGYCKCRPAPARPPPPPPPVPQMQMPGRWDDNDDDL